MYTYINNLYPGNPDVARSYALRLLIHYIGDLMEPLHNEDKYDAVKISGDNWGNSFTRPNLYDAVYDMVMYGLHNNIARPFTQATWDAFQPQVLDMMVRHQDLVTDPSVYQNINFDDWSAVSYDIGTTLYSGKFQRF